MSEFLDFFKLKKNLVSVLILGILILALPLGITLLQRQQNIKSRANVDPIVFSGNVEQRNGNWVATKSQVSLELTSPLGPPEGENTSTPGNTLPPTNPPYSSPTIVPTVVPTTASTSVPTIAPTIAPIPTTIPNYATFNVGFNTAGIVHYGYGDILRYASFQDVDSDLKEINRMKGKILRVFVANDNVTDNETAKRLDTFLTKAAAYNISVIVSFINFYGDNPFRPQGTQKYYTDTWNSIKMLNHDFFAGGYKAEYLSFIRTVVSYNKNHTNIYAWEPGNELKDSSSPQAFIAFMKDVSQTIKSIDPVHKIATGMINAAHSALVPENLYSQLPNIDIITIHNYNGSRDGLTDVSWAVSHGKIAINEELGFSGQTDRSSLVRQEIEFWRSQGVKAVLQWGFLAKGTNDNGDGDRTYGMDTVWHTDYNQLASFFTSVN